jgi:hypothetical protein
MTARSAAQRLGREFGGGSGHGAGVAACPCRGDVLDAGVAVLCALPTVVVGAVRSSSVVMTR